MPTARAAFWLTLLLVGLATAACGANAPAGDTGGATPSPSRQATSPPTDTSGEQMKIQITIADQSYPATIFNSPAGRDLIAQLPLTVAMTDHGSVEKTGPLPAPLSLEGQPDGADPAVGDVGYYAPGNDLVFYYGDQSYYPGIVIIGRLVGDAAGRIADLNGAVTATVEPRTA